jgi:transposase
MRFVAPLSEPVKKTLDELLKNHPNHRTRTRGHMILLSADGFRIDEIARIYKVQRDTLGRCFQNWESKGIVGLFDSPKRGRPRALSPQESERAIELLKEDPRSSKQAQSRLEDEIKRQISEWTFKRIAKRAGLHWKRMRRSLKNKRNQADFEKTQQEIAVLHEREAKEELDVYYYDESGVSLTPDIPYGWQASSETKELPSSRSKRLNILGFYSRDNRFEATTIEGWVNSEMVIACFDRFCETVEKETVVIIDNASTHTSHAFKAKLSNWADKGLIVKNLPTYSPELNIIEILWRFIKYQWLPLSAYQSYKQLKQELQKVLDGVGSQYLISFA